MINRVKEYEPVQEGQSLMTTLGIISGEALTLLERNGAMSLRSLIRELPWAMPVVTMAIGALIREGLIKAEQHELEIVIEPRRDWQIPAHFVKEPAYGIWGD